MTVTCPTSPENGTWDFNPNSWKQLFGSFPNQGISIEWHDFKHHEDVEWSKSFHEDSLELCLNFSGLGSVRQGRRQASFRSGTVGYYFPLSERPSASRVSDEHHQFITVELSRSFLQANVLNEEESLVPAVKSFLSGSHQKDSAVEVKPMNSTYMFLGNSLRQPPPFKAGKSLWYQSKTLELMSHLLFIDSPESELFCSRQKRIARERVEHLKNLLQNHLESPLSLKALGKEVGCSPFYLSRIFSKETGMTIPQYLRKMRMQRAEELLRSGKCNVTEAALEVGYSSVSHFSKAFSETFGSCPCFYPQRKLSK